MRKQLFITSLSLLVEASAFAQQPTPESALASTPSTAVASTDSVKAVQRLFRSRRTGSNILGFPAGYCLGYGAVATAQGEAGAAGTLGIGVVLSTVTIAKGVRFSKMREEEILTAYQQGKPIPKNVRRRLRKKHFNA